jgi:hypothetical protein
MNLIFKLLIKEKYKFTWCNLECLWLKQQKDNSAHCILMHQSLYFYDGWLIRCLGDQHLKKIG